MDQICPDEDPAQKAVREAFNKAKFHGRVWVVRLPSNVGLKFHPDQGLPLGALFVAVVCEDQKDRQVVEIWCDRKNLVYGMIDFSRLLKTKTSLTVEGTLPIKVSGDSDVLGRTTRVLNDISPGMRLW